MRKKNKSRIQQKRSPEQTEAWILGTGTASLASAFFLIKHAKLSPHKVHILESRDSAKEVLHRKGDPFRGYDQFAGCLPVPIGDPLKEILASIPSSIPSASSEQTFLNDIQSAESYRKFTKQSYGTGILVQRNHFLRNIATQSLNLNLKHRFNLIRLLLKREKRLGRNQIGDFFPDSFFQTSFWAVWSAQ